MKQLIEYLEMIKNTQGTNAKQNILYEMIESIPDVEEFFRIVYNDDVYGVSEQTWKKVFNYPSESYDDVGELVYKNSKYDLTDEFDLKTLKNILEDIKRLSGNELILYLKNILTFDPYHNQLLARIINKDLRIGVQLKTINKVFKQLKLKPIEKFQVQLCGKEDFVKNWNIFPVMVGVKYDGFRCIVNKVGDKITLTSRQGKDVSEFLPEIIENLLKIPHNFILDGEILADSFNDIQHRIGRKIEHLEPVKGLHYRVFDVLKWNDTEYKNFGQKQRTEALNLLLGEYDEKDLIKLEEIYYVEEKSRLTELYNEMIKRKEEGIVIKLIDKPYEYDSRKNWFKIKPIYENTFKIINYDMGSGKFKDTIGAIHITDLNGNIKAKVGSGLNDNDRKELLLYAKNNSLIGKYVDIAYSEITKNQNNLHYSLRFPRFLKLREDKSEADDINIDNIFPKKDIIHKENDEKQLNLEDF